MLEAAKSFFAIPEVQARVHEFDLERQPELKRM